MWKYAVPFFLFATMANAIETKCRIEPDVITFKDDGIGKAIVFFRNSSAGCSEGSNYIWTTPNGISARIIIEPNADKDASKERITVIPLTLGMSAYPPEAEIFDGEKTTIIVTGGMM